MPPFTASGPPKNKHSSWMSGTLLTSNEPLDESESAFTESAHNNTRLAYLDCRISKLREKLKALEEERASFLHPRPNAE
jgi:hypothetical protein